MLRFRNLNLISQNPNFSNRFSYRSSLSFSLPLFTSNHLSQCFIRSFMAPSSKITVEYAKSNRSSCKKCGKAISANTMRLGLVILSKDSRGFDVIKWHHSNCFPTDSQPIDSVEKIDGFSLLKSSDQEELKKLMDGSDLSPKEDGVEGSDQNSWKESKVRKADEIPGDKLEGSKSKKPKRSDPEEVNTLMGGNDLTPKEVRKADEIVGDELEGSKSKKPKIVVEYAKSNRSSCKKCDKAISAKTMRLGLVSRDSRGFDMKKWHHLNCFPIDSQPIDSVEKIDGFSLLKSNDQEELKKLMDGSDISPKEGGVEGSDKKSLKESKVRKADEISVDELEGSKLEKPKEVKLEMSFSISDVKDKYKDASLFPKWKAFQTIIFLERDEGLHDSAKIAAFDFDGCLANTSVRRTGADAWSLMYPSIPEKLKSLYDDGYKLVIFTNESNIERWKNKRQVAVDSKIGRLNNFIEHVKVPIQVFIACGLGKTDPQAEDPFRKPKPGMWRIMEQQFNSGIKIDMDQSFYVGDAAGRPNDHSNADIEFAKAIGLKFFVPEDYFGA